MWLEIQNNIVIGVHSEKLSSSAQWVEYDGDVMPGDTWSGSSHTQQPPEFTDEELIDLAAREQIFESYPLWKQLNIIREGNTEELTKMGSYIDSVRDWSNTPGASLDDLALIEP